MKAEANFEVLFVLFNLILFHEFYESLSIITSSKSVVFASSRHSPDRGRASHNAALHTLRDIDSYKWLVAAVNKE